MTCRHAEPVASIELQPDGTTRHKTRLYCHWPDHAAPAQLLDMPRWLQNHALAGHPVTDKDCAGCPCRKPLAE